VELDQLRYFAEVVRRGTYAEAATHLSVSQPAIWKRVNNLERELGIALFERVGRRVRPTTAGRQLAEQAAGVIAAAERLREDATAISRGTRGLVRLVCSPPHLERLAGAIARFVSEQPEVELRIVEAGEIDPVALLGSGQADVVTAAANLRAPGGFPMYETRVVAIFPPGEGTRRPGHVSVDEFEGRPLLTAPSGYYSRVELEAACSRKGFQPSILIESANASALATMAEQGVGVAVIADDALPSTRRGLHPTVMTEAGPLRREVWCYSNTGYPPADILSSTIKRKVGSSPR
jgi:LysR family hydrogen peroxide-inducible transcriptional activator